MKKLTKDEIKANADEVKFLTMAQIEALPSMLGAIASMECNVNGFYSFISQGKRIFIELVA